MSHPVSAKDAARHAAQERLQLRSPACKRRLKRRERILRLKDLAIHSQGLQLDGENQEPLSPMGAAAISEPRTAESPVVCRPTNRRRLALFPTKLPARPQEVAGIHVPLTVSNLPDEAVTDIAGVGSLLESNPRTSLHSPKGALEGGRKDGTVVILQPLEGMLGREADPPLCSVPLPGSQGGRRGCRQGRGKKVGVDGDGSAIDSHENRAARRGGKGHSLKKGKRGKEVNSTVVEVNSTLPVLRDIGTPPGWFPPAIEVETQQSPRRLRGSVSMNLIFRLQDARHGLDRLVLGLPSLEIQNQFEGTCIEEDETAISDYKETPGSGCKSAERLRIIREGKRPLADSGPANSTRPNRNSLDWYNSCSDGGGCIHLGDSDNVHSPVAVPEGGDVVTHVWVPRPALGLSPAGGSSNMLRGEVIKEFEHIITLAIMYKIDFGGVLGIIAVEKDKCIAVSEGNDVGAMQLLEDGNHELKQPTQESTFTLQLPSYLEDAADSDEVATDPDWEGNFEDWQGNSDSGTAEALRGFCTGVAPPIFSKDKNASHLEGNFTKGTVEYLSWLASP